MKIIRQKKTNVPKTWVMLSGVASQFECLYRNFSFLPRPKGPDLLLAAHLKALIQTTGVVCMKTSVRPRLDPRLSTTAPCTLQRSPSSESQHLPPSAPVPLLPPLTSSPGLFQTRSSLSLPRDRYKPDTFLPRATPPWSRGAAPPQPLPPAGRPGSGGPQEQGSLGLRNSAFSPVLQPARPTEGRTRKGEEGREALPGPAAPEAGPGQAEGAAALPPPLYF